MPAHPSDYSHSGSPFLIMHSTSCLGLSVSIRNRYIVAVCGGVVLHFLFFHPYLPYSVREHRMPGFGPMVISLLIVGFAVTFRAAGHTARICAFVVLGMCLGNTVLMMFDWMKDPTTHNLFPFEFIMIASAMIPVYAGGLLSRWMTGTQAPSKADS